MATPKGYKAVHGKMEVNFTVELPKDCCKEPVMCDDPAIEAAMQGVSQHLNVYLWGEDRDAAAVYCEVNELDVEIEDDER